MDELERLLRILAYEGMRAGRGVRDVARGGLDVYTRVHAPRTAGQIAQAGSYLASLPGTSGLPAPVSSQVSRVLERFGDETADYVTEQERQLAAEDVSTAEQVGRVALGEIAPTGLEYILGGGAVRKGLGLGREVVEEGAGRLARASASGREALKDAAAVLPIDAVLEAPEGTSTADALAELLGDENVVGRVAGKAAETPLGRIAFGAGLGTAGDLGLRGGAQAAGALREGGRTAARLAGESVPDAVRAPEEIARAASEASAAGSRMVLGGAAGGAFGASDENDLTVGQGVIGGASAALGAPGALRMLERGVRGGANRAGHLVPPGGARKLPGEVDTGLKGRWVSPLKESIERAPQDVATAEQWAGMLKKAPGSKGEREAVGIDEFLASRAGERVTRAEIEEFIEANRPKLTETVKGTTSQLDVDAAEAAYTSALEDMHALAGEMERVGLVLRQDGQVIHITDRDGGFVESVSTSGARRLGGAGEHDELIESYAESRRWLDRAARAVDEVYDTARKPKFAGYTIGEYGRSPESNYREVLIQLDDTPRRRERDLFKSSHWDEPNVLAHLRVTDRDVGGDRTYMIEEIQSDWHQKGREAGYADTAQRERLTRERSELAEARDRVADEVRAQLGEPPETRPYDASGRDTRGAIAGYNARFDRVLARHPDADLYREWSDHIREIDRALGVLPRGGVPDAPFKRTEDWVALSFRRALQEAAEGGYDRVAWVSGEQAADMYDLRKHVSRIEYDEATGRLQAFDHDGGTAILEQGVSPEQLPDYIGKDPARRLMESTPESAADRARSKGWPADEVRDLEETGGAGVRAIEGDDLAVGGEGMTTFYNRIVPNVVKKEAKRLGVEIEPVRVGAPDVSRTQSFEDMAVELGDGSVGVPVVGEGGYGLMYEDGHVDWLGRDRYQVFGDDPPTTYTLNAAKNELSEPDVSPTNLSIRLTPRARDQILNGGMRIGGVPAAVSHALGGAAIGGATGAAVAPEGQEAEYAAAGAVVGGGGMPLILSRLGRGARKAAEAPAPSRAPDVPAEPPKAVTDEPRAPDSDLEVPPRPNVKPEFQSAPEPTPPNVVSLRKEEGAAIRARLGLDALPEPDRQSFANAWDESASRNLDNDAIAIALEAVESRRPLRPEEHAAAVQRYVKLENELNDSRVTLEAAAKAGNDEIVRRESLRTDAILQQIDALTEATDRAGTEAGRALSIRRLRANTETYTLASGLQRARAKKGTALTPDEIGNVEQLTARIAELDAENAALRKAAEEADLARQAQAAEAVAKMEARRTKRGADRAKQLEVESVEIKRALVELGVKLNDVSGVSAEGLYLIGRLAANHIQRRALQAGTKVELDEIVDAVLGDLNNPSLTRRDILEAMNARDPRAKGRTRTEIQRQTAELRRQAKLLTQIEDAEEGIFAPTRKRPPTSGEIKRLQDRLTELRAAAYRTGADARRLELTVKTINDLQDQLANHYRTIRRRKEVPTAELQALKTRVQGLRQEMGVVDRLADLEHQLKTGEFKVPVKRRAVTSPELERNQIALKRARQRWRQAIDSFEDPTLRSRVRESAAFLRTMKATADMSATLRQGLWLSASRPMVAAGAFGKSFLAFFSAHTADQIEVAMRGHPNQLIRDKAGLALTEIGGPIGQREEYFASQLAERIPVIGQVVKASERSMGTTLNLLRVAAFDDFVEKFPNATLEEMKAWANWVNVASGRGDLGRLAPIATELSVVVFAPRFAASRIQTPFMVLRHAELPRVRKAIAKDYAATVGLGLSALGLASAAGLGVGLDPRDSDFGKIRIGDTRIDIWAGVQQPVRLLSRVMLGMTDKAGLTGDHLTDSEKAVNPLELLGRFAAFKLSPIVTVPLEFYRGQTAVGEDVTPAQTAVRAMMPLILEDVYETYRLAGPERAALTGSLQFVGVGASTYGDSESKVRRNARRLMEEGNARAARLMISEWNEKNPDNQIRSVQPRQQR